LTYSEDADIIERLDLLGDQATERAEELKSVRERANRWIKVWFSRYNLAPQDENSLEGEYLMLKDIEADYGAYLYWRDYHEWSQEGGEGKKRSLWREDARSNLIELLKSKAGEQFYDTGDEITYDAGSS